MSFIDKVISRYCVVAGDVVNFQAFKNKQAKKTAKPDHKSIMTDFLTIIADALVKDGKGWKVEEPKKGSDVLDVWCQDKKLGFIELTATGVVDNRGIGGTMEGVLIMPQMSDDDEPDDIEVEINNKGEVNSHDLLSLSHAIKDAFDKAADAMQPTKKGTRK